MIWCDTHQTTRVFTYTDTTSFCVPQTRHEQPQTHVHLVHTCAQRRERATPWPHQHTASHPSEEPQPSQRTLLVLGLDPKLDVLFVLLRAGMPERIAKRDTQLALAVALHQRRWAARALEVVGVDDADRLLVAEREVAEGGGALQLLVQPLL